MKALSIARFVVVVLYLATTLPAFTTPVAQVTANAEPTLEATIALQDAELFDAVNRCDLKTVESKFAEDVEFYHDKADPQYGRAIVLKNIKANLCGQIQRELVPGSLEVYPIHGYGAVEIGVHRFNHIGTKDRDVVGEAKFIHLWRLKDGAWQITRVISYGHEAAKTTSEPVAK
jgi:ketosteroid isomerase-like protein